MKYKLIFILLLFSMGCVNHRLSRDINFIEKTVLVTHDHKCKMINSVILGLDKSFQIVNLKVYDNYFSGTIKSYDSLKNPDRQFIYTIDLKNCSYILIGVTDEEGKFIVPFYKNKFYGFLNIKLDETADEYLFGVEIVSKIGEQL